jgi:uncharacterized protein YbdZ (MbtH family)
LSINPVDDDDGSFFVLVNEEEHRGPSPTFADVADDWRAVYGQADRAACFCNVEQSWTDIRPKSLREGWHRAAVLTSKRQGEFDAP